MKSLLLITAALELGAGLELLAVPALVAMLYYDDRRGVLAGMMNLSDWRTSTAKKEK